MPWKTLSSQTLVETRAFCLRQEKCEVFDKRTMPSYYILDFKNPWVHVVALTEKKELLLIRQYRHAARQFFLELPGGSVELEKESSRTSALRELEEETGYSTSDMKEVGSYYPNPALQNNKVHVFLAQNCKKTGEQNLDPFEDISVEKVPLKDWEKLFLCGDCHGLMLSSLFLVKNYL